MDSIIRKEHVRKEYHMYIWLVVIAVLGGIWFCFHVKKHGSKVGAAKNALLAKHTFPDLQPEVRSQVVERAKHILQVRGIRDPSKKLEGMSEAERYCFFALAMAELEIRPSLGNELWHYVENPFVAFINAQSHIDAARNDLNEKHGVEITLATDDVT